MSIAGPRHGTLAWGGARSALGVASELIDESHFHVMILACPRCSQRFLSVFTETIDWADGEDPQYWTLLPVTEAEAAGVFGQRESLTETMIETLGPGRRCLRRAHPKRARPTADLGRGYVRRSARLSIIREEHAAMLVGDLAETNGRQKQTRGLAGLGMSPDHLEDERAERITHRQPGPPGPGVEVRLGIDEPGQHRVSAAQVVPGLLTVRAAAVQAAGTAGAAVSWGHRALPSPVHPADRDTQSAGPREAGHRMTQNR